MLRGTRRPANSSLNTPVAIHAVGTPSHLTKEETLKFLSAFIEQKETIPKATLSEDSGHNQDVITSGGISLNEIAVDTQLSSALAQLKRIERDFKGLPPQIVESELEDKTTTNVSKSDTGGKKIKFSDEPVAKDSTSGKESSESSAEESPSSDDSADST